MRIYETGSSNNDQLPSIATILVVKMKFKEMKRRTAVGRKVNAVYKTWRGTAGELRKLRKP